jgi:hypothetical protein
MSNLKDLKVALPDLLARPLSLIAFFREAAKQSARILKGDDLPLPYVEVFVTGGMALVGIVRAIQEATDPSAQFETDTGKLYQLRIEAVQAATVARLATPEERDAFRAL